MGQIISIDYILVPLLEAILYIYSVAPFSDFFTYRFVPTGLLKLITHRTVLEKRNLYPGREDSHVSFDFSISFNSKTIVICCSSL